MGARRLSERDLELQALAEQLNAALRANGIEPGLGAAKRQGDERNHSTRIEIWFDACLGSEQSLEYLKKLIETLNRSAGPRGP